MKRLHQGIAVFIPEGTAEYGKEIHKPAKAQTAEGQGIDDSGADLAQVETVNTCPAKKKAEKEREPLAVEAVGFLLPGVSLGPGLFHSGPGCRGRGFEGKATVTAVIGIIGIFFSAIRTEHNISFLP